MLRRQGHTSDGVADKALRARYTLDKFRAFTAYSASVSSGRVALVILLTPVTTVLGSLVLPVVPLRDPNEGLQKNLGGFVAHLTLISWLTMFGASIQSRAGANITHEEYSTFFVALGSLVGALLLVGLGTLVGALWRFPVPFFWVLFATPWAIFMLSAHLLVSRGRLVRCPEVRRKIYRYLPSFTVQISQIILYPVLSAAFGSTSEWQQVALTYVFPVIKYILKKILRSLTHSFEDFAEEAAISDVEICAALYQSMIMQTRPSAYTTAFVIGVDLFVGVVAVKLLMDKHSVVPQSQIISTATTLVHQHKLLINDSKLDAYATQRCSPLNVFASFFKRLVSLRKGRVATQGKSLNRDDHGWCRPHNRQWPCTER